MAKRGAKPKYDPATTPDRIARLAAAGGRDIDIAKGIGVSEATLNNWKKRYPEILESLKEGKDEIDNNVVCALLKNALGYTITETKRYYKPLFDSKGEPVFDKGGKQVKGLVREEVTEKEVQPSTVAQIFWLKNRQPEEWRANTDMSNLTNAKGEVNQLFDQMKVEASLVGVAGST